MDPRRTFTMTQHQVKSNAEQICHANPSPNETLLINRLLGKALVEDSVFTFVHAAHRSWLLGQVRTEEDVPQNNPYLGRGKKKTDNDEWMGPCYYDSNLRT